MPLSLITESTIACLEDLVDNSEYMRNGDFAPSRLQAQQDAANLVSQCKLRLNPENNVGVLSMANGIQVLVTLTSDSSKIFSKLHQVKPNGKCDFLSALRVAHLALKHRQGRMHKTRIVLFVGSPVNVAKDKLTQLGKRLKKEKVNVDIINLGEAENEEKLKVLVEALNGREGTGSHMVTVPSDSALSEALLSSPILRSEDGTAPMVAVGGGMDYGAIDPNEDPELAIALRVSMEEQRARQEEEVRRGVEGGTTDVPAASTGRAPADTNVDAMTEDEQIALALQMSLQQGDEAEGGGTVAMETDESASTKAERGSETSSVSEVKDSETDFGDLLTDPAALEEMVKGLPGVDPNSKVVQESIASCTQKTDKKDGKKDKEDSKK